MEPTNLTDSIARIKEQLEKERFYKDIPFPLSHLLYMNEIANHAMYCDYMEGFKLMVEWLDPIASPAPDSKEWFGQLHSNYEASQICSILGINYGQLFNGYKTTATLIQQQAHAAFLSKKIPTVQTKISP